MKVILFNGSPKKNGCTYTALTEIEKALNDEKICARSGLQCSPLAHKTLNTLGTGLIRLSLSVFNNETEIDKVYKTILRCIKR